jgi:hypothetical protein
MCQPSIMPTSAGGGLGGGGWGGSGGRARRGSGAKARAREEGRRAFDAVKTHVKTVTRASSIEIEAFVVICERERPAVGPALRALVKQPGVDFIKLPDGSVALYLAVDGPRRAPVAF